MGLSPEERSWVRALPLLLSSAVAAFGAAWFALSKDENAAAAIFGVVALVTFGSWMGVHVFDMGLHAARRRNPYDGRDEVDSSSP